MPSYQYPSHPGDFFRDASPHEVPNPDVDLEAFLVAFLDCYQSDEKIALLNDLYKLQNYEFESEVEEQKFKDSLLPEHLANLEQTIQHLESKLRIEAEMNYTTMIDDGYVSF